MSSPLLSIPTASNAAPASTSASASGGAARARDAQAGATDSFGAALARTRESRGQKAGEKTERQDDAASASPLARRRGASSAESTEERSPVDLLAMAMLTPAFATQAAQKRQAAADGTGASLHGAADASALAKADPPLAAAAGDTALTDSQPQDAATAQARASGKPIADAKADARSDAASEDGKKVKADAGATSDYKITAQSAPVVAAASASAAPAAPLAGAASTGAPEPKAGNAAPAIAAVDPKVAPEPAAAALRADDRPLPDTSSEADTASTLPASMNFKAAMAQASATSSTAQQPPVARLAVPTPVGSEGWGADVGRQMIRMGADGNHVAELSLNPAGLGPLKVTLTLGDNQAQAMFVSAHESVRRAVEAALPQLRDTLASQGIQLGQTSVDAGTQQQQAFGQQERGFEQQGRPNLRGAQRETAADDAPLAVRASSSGARASTGIDTFA
ncbi:flagellar hook-length control protein FliK [Variovorax sp. OV329]|uniref:flagellar hook-length control protein FliK n=1 Tax=Variovorax sp. OV329 TaxID=1882825 RepID=UPI0008E37083|nr:flagellar hook-length control protein FliK [Variovorax sp. OV329]SFM65629.1 flagellar hook-length control protein FliK [Variovorax sp. OV329]